MRGTRLAKMDIAGEHDMVGAQPALRRDHPLAHAGGVDRQRRRLLEDARARRLGRRRKAERIVERMDVERLRREHRVEIVVALEHVAHALDRPAFDLTAEVLADQADGGEISSASSDFATLSQPSSTGSTPGMPVSRMVVRTYSKPGFGRATTAPWRRRARPA